MPGSACIFVLMPNAINVLSRPLAFIALLFCFTCILEHRSCTFSAFQVKKGRNKSEWKEKGLVTYHIYSILRVLKEKLDDGTPIRQLRLQFSPTCGMPSISCGHVRKQEQVMRIRDFVRRVFAFLGLHHFSEAWKSKQSCSDLPSCRREQDGSFAQLTPREMHFFCRRLVEARNPWAWGEWKGDWCDSGSKKGESGKWAENPQLRERVLGKGGAASHGIH